MAQGRRRRRLLLPLDAGGNGGGKENLGERTERRRGLDEKENIGENANAEEKVGNRKEDLSMNSRQNHPQITHRMRAKARRCL
eukprot:CAMPEP_0113582234 /NCGR_PEP_ID=MMETSP0015_2-20120614/31781_1 /TAXON_ID=2838 /ORGANISM="Odontella" /LENGTH=82 /DNA_ID=CAMNT_0000486843 /DNA_START=34 /DNA_END=282 /DNA_ORIENTATION=- /assembly_acc=CAM_ASM_000160